MKYRPDIDGLRALAVLGVIAFHGFPGRVRGGFVGVDVFFVISGYLISGIVMDGLAARRFTFADFYRRRARRIFPALLVVLAAVLMAGWLLLLPGEFAELAKEITGGALFSANFLDWRETGYFDTAARLKPLLHLWSLGIEEQFYILWPATLVMLWRLPRWRVPAIGLLLVASFMANVFLVVSYPAATFYLPVTRFWELLIGAVLAASYRQGTRILPDGRAWTNAAAVAGLAAIGGSMLLFTTQTRFPGAAALLPTIGTALLIVAGSRDASNAVSARILANPLSVYIGKISYPLYLWHWPLLAIASLYNFDALLPTPVKLALLLAAFPASALTYKFIETPLRFGRARRHGTPYLVAAIGCMALVGLFAPELRARSGIVPAADQTNAAQFEWRYWQNSTCLDRYPWHHVHGWWFCMANQARPPTVVLLGDSHANQLFPGLVALPEFASQSVLDIGTCLPAQGIAERSLNIGEEPCATQRAVQQQTFIDHIIATSPSIRLAIVTAAWPAFDSEGAQIDQVPGKSISGTFYTVGGGNTRLTQAEQLRRGLDREISFLDTRGISVVLILGTPLLPYEPQACFSRPFRRATRTCELDARHIREVQSGFRKIAADLQREHPHLAVFDPLPAFCSDTVCWMRNGGITYMRDSIHLSLAGSKLLAFAFASWLRDADATAWARLQSPTMASQRKASSHRSVNRHVG